MPRYRPARQGKFPAGRENFFGDDAKHLGFLNVLGICGAQAGNFFALRREFLCTEQGILCTEQGISSAIQRHNAFHRFNAVFIILL
jgi:hypothetical protein